MSDPEFRPFNRGLRGVVDDGGPPVRRRPPVLTRMRLHADLERAWREEKIVDNLNAAWQRAYSEFKARGDGG